MQIDHRVTGTAISLTSARRFISWCIGGYDCTPDLVVEVPLSKSRVVSYLSERVKKPWYAKYYGSVNESEFQIAVGHIFVGNNWWPTLHGRIVELPGGCKIVCRFDISPITKTFVSLWLSVATIFAIGACVQSLIVGHTNEFLVIALAIPLWGLGVARAGRLIAKLDEVKLIKLIRELQKNL